MRYGYWLPVFGGWLRNVDDENMAPTLGVHQAARAAQRADRLRSHARRRTQPERHQGRRGAVARCVEHGGGARRGHRPTSRLMVAVRPTFHNPALLAKQAANIDHIGGGRLSLNVVSSWWEDEATQVRRPLRAARRPLRPHGGVARRGRRRVEAGSLQFRGQVLPGGRQGASAEAGARSRGR